MRIIGLTGSIACGKSTVSGYLSAQGFPVIDGDVLSRELTAEGSPVLPEIRRQFGPSVFAEDGSLDRRALGRLVFSDEKALRRLDEMMYLPLLSLTKERIRRAQASGAELCFLDMPLLFEKEFDRLCDTTWTVWLPEDLQLSRLTARDGISRQEALSRMRSVFSSDEKAARARCVIDNSGPVSQTLAVVDSLLQEELRRARPSARPRRSDRFAAGPVAADESVETSPYVVQETLYDPQPQTPTFQMNAPAAQMQSRVPCSFPVPQPVPETMDRPDAARRKPSSRKASLPLPPFMKAILLVLAAALLIGIAVYSVMTARLVQLRDQHQAEKEKTEYYYHVSDLFSADETAEDPCAMRMLIEKYAQEYNLTPAFVAAVIRNESSFDSSAESKDSSGQVIARGLMQLKESTAAWIAQKLKVQGYAYERMYDPESNIRFGCWYLNYLSGLFGGRPACVVAAYHAGQGQVTKWLCDTAISRDGLSFEPDDLPDGPTKNYTKEVLKCYGIYQEIFDQASSAAAGADAAVPGGAAGAGEEHQ